MTDNNIMKCQKAGHMNQKYLYLNFSASSQQSLLICPICISQEQFVQISENKKIPQNLLIDQILDYKVSSHEILGWPPIQEEKNKKIFKESQNFLKKIGNQQGSLLNFFKEKIVEDFDYFQKKINDQIYILKKEAIVGFESYFSQCYQNQNQEEQMKIIEDLIKKFEVDSFRKQFQEFEKNNINIDQIYQFQQQQQYQIFGNQEVYDQLQQQQEKFQQLQKKVEQNKEKLEEIISNFQKNTFREIQDVQLQNPRGINKLQFFKSQKNNNQHKGAFEIDNQNQKIIFKKENGRFSKFVYSTNLQLDQNYHLRLKLDLANQVANTDLSFIFTDQKYKDSDFFGFTYHMYPFQKLNKAYGNGRYLQYVMEGKQFFEFFQDNQTVVNFVFNIEQCLFEIYDDQKIFYMKFEVSQKIIYDNFILMIGFKQEKQNNDVQIQFLN